MGAFQAGERRGLSRHNEVRDATEGQMQTVPLLHKAVGQFQPVDAAF